MLLTLVSSNLFSILFSSISYGADEKKMFNNPARTFSLYSHEVRYLAVILHVRRSEKCFNEMLNG